MCVCARVHVCHEKDTGAEAQRRVLRAIYIDARGTMRRLDLAPGGHSPYAAAMMAGAVALSPVTVRLNSWTSAGSPAETREALYPACSMSPMN